MRIIAGTARGLRLKMVPGKHVRPTADRVKESLFHIIGPFFDGGWVLDLFAGTGALGLEALSRGMDRAVFVDRHRLSVETIRANVQLAGFEKQSEIYQRDARAAIRVLARRGIRFQFVFVDPPYREGLHVPVLKQLAVTSILEKNGMVVVESASDQELPKAVEELHVTRELEYGDTVIRLYQQQSDA
ncbi:methyltransferase [Polycladomyces abyssicola]|uniref:Methyltransferase n=1 Tax=Polycladomyces abyssicola TaxID=1125966 RepID=A0A8D5ZL56_9BACL|nr:16S rRNA (guanine(966)-N(2))-methyltransferase RsmD [Polycladomyces abyssicola]BCU82169.1 methyltransferase [Polycladomyces abyssicola]